MSPPENTEISPRYAGLFLPQKDEVVFIFSERIHGNTNTKLLYEGLLNSETNYKVPEASTVNYT